MSLNDRDRDPATTLYQLMRQQQQQRMQLYIPRHRLGILDYITHITILKFKCAFHHIKRKWYFTHNQ